MDILQYVLQGYYCTFCRFIWKVSLSKYLNAAILRLFFKKTGWASAGRTNLPRLSNLTITKTTIKDPQYYTYWWFCYIQQSLTQRLDQCEHKCEHISAFWPLSALIWAERYPPQPLSLACIPQLDPSSHESWNRVQPSLELFSLVLSVCTIFPDEILQPARDTAKGAGEQFLESELLKGTYLQ